MVGGKEGRREGGGDLMGTYRGKLVQYLVQGESCPFLFLAPILLLPPFLVFFPSFHLRFLRLVCQK